MDAELRELKHAIAEPVPADIGAVPARRQRRGRPELPGLLVAEVKCLAARVTQGIVVPGREPEFRGVVHPCISPAAFRDHGADLCISQHIRPRGGRGLSGCERDHILASVGRETAEAVEEDALARWGRCRRRRQWRSGRGETWNLARDRRLPLDLLGHRLRAVREDRPRDRLQQDAVFLGKLLAPPQENPAGLVHPVRFGAGGNQADDALLQDLTISGKILVKNDQIEFQSLLAQVGVRLESLLHQFDPVRIGDTQQENRQVTRDTEWPQARLAEPVSGDDSGIGAKERICLN